MLVKVSNRYAFNTNNISYVEWIEDKDLHLRICLRDGHKFDLRKEAAQNFLHIVAIETVEEPTFYIDDEVRKESIDVPSSD